MGNNGKYGWEKYTEKIPTILHDVATFLQEHRGKIEVWIAWILLCLYLGQKGQNSTLESEGIQKDSMITEFKDSLWLKNKLINWLNHQCQQLEKTAQWQQDTLDIVFGKSEKVLSQEKFEQLKELWISYWESSKKEENNANNTQQSDKIFDNIHKMLGYIPHFYDMDDYFVVCGWSCEDGDKKVKEYVKNLSFYDKYGNPFTGQIDFSEKKLIDDPDKIGTTIFSRDNIHIEGYVMNWILVAWKVTCKDENDKESCFEGSFSRNWKVAQGTYTENGNKEEVCWFLQNAWEK